ncbi:DEAD/DEAH box helicase [Clostridium sp. 19966]|uniref:DEAD/DEAH box helicase n=1 Tax=Clostridium sp. 19966 TaxID=2768166 RepID=UPI0028DF0507|nr:DEAD/DEAH box helicase [Clostridium sp. 19966]MDT8718264.1 DEAD/DEAH box helicase [Clostridium sp. 19966]
MILKTGLYNHQIKATEKLRSIKVGALYMEMGTGKTRTALELIRIRLDAGKINKVLWLCPCSVKENLRRDLLKHCDDISNIYICGIETLSRSIRTNTKLLELVKENSIFLIVDESNLVKNHAAKRTQNIERLAEYCRYKLILNGTPISKSEKDLFAQWYILDWRILGYQSFWSFAANHLEYDKNIPGKVNKCLNTDYLVRKIAPYTYQVKKSECLDLPDKTYSVKYFFLSNEQEAEYDRVKELFLSDVNEFDETTIYRMLSAMQSVISGNRIISELHKRIQYELMFKDPLDNPRIQCLLNYVDTDEKTIIFCKYTDEIKTIEKILNNIYGVGSAVTFYGELNQKQRQKNLDLFKTTSNFLIANKQCGAYGLNLQFCCYIIYYSNDWDYATRSQSEDRVHRIGQNKNVHIVDICAANKLDERILNCLARKENLVDSFKKEIEAQKDKKYLDLWLSGKTLHGKRYRKKVVNEFEELKEEIQN